MAIHASAKKAARQANNRNERNRAIRANCRKLVTQTREELGKKKPALDKIGALLKKTESSLMKAVSKGVYKKKTVGRMVSRLNLAAPQKA